MGQAPSGGLNRPGGDRKSDDANKKEKKYEPAAPPSRVGRKQRKQKGPEAAGPLDQYHQLYEILMRMEARMDFDEACIDYCLRRLDVWFDRVERKLGIDHPADLDSDS
nr:26s proteasome regulatory subunit 4 like a [Quercus suber]